MERNRKDRAKIALWAFKEMGERSGWSTQDFRRTRGTVRLVF
jgi:hypothetical protein